MIEFDRVTCATRDVMISATLSSVTAVIGANGSGKSTLLELVAGALRPDSGTLRLGSQTLAGPGVFVPTNRRGCAYLEQRPLLFPHMSVLANATFQASQERARTELDLVGCADLANRRPSELSGGQQQRVAIARALAIDPAVVLLDEPMAALDTETAQSLRALLAKRLHGRTTLIATHDLLDVIWLADHVCVLEGGKVVEHAPTTDVLARPQSSFAARFIGTNLFQGIASDKGILLGGHELIGDATLPAGVAALAHIPPSAVALYRDPPSGSPRNVWPGEVRRIESLGSTIRLWVRVGEHTIGADVTPAAVVDLALTPGAAVHAAVKATQVRIYPIKSTPTRRNTGGDHPNTARR